jgi:hypothetical protein
MKWSHVCSQYPDQIVLVEALKTSSKNKILTIEEMSILSEFHDSMDAWQEYKKIHREKPEKEIYIFHTSKEKAEVVEQYFVGIRGTHENSY